LEYGTTTEGSGRNLSIVVFIKSVTKLAVVNIEGSLLPTAYRILSNILFSRLPTYVDEITED
jgi:hypothetical protein